MPTELHIALQQHYAGDDGQVEVPFERYKLDVVTNGVAYEIQTGNFFKLKAKLERLAEAMPTVLVYPLPQTKIIVRVDAESGEELSQRRSPKQGVLSDIFPELRHVAAVLGREGVSLEIVLTVERELRDSEAKTGRYHRRAALLGRELVEVVEQIRFDKPEDYVRLLPPNLPKQFTVADLAQSAGINRWLGGHMASALYQLGATQRVGKQGNAYVYEPVGPVDPEDSNEQQDAGWLQVRCAECGTVGLQARPGSLVRWRCGKCRSLQVQAVD